MENLYLYINLFTLAGPFLLSFDKKVAFWRTWFALFPAILIMAAVFIPWDVAFAAEGVWGFNGAYLSGVYLFGLPLGEWLFFLTVPYACVFIYACLNAYFPRHGNIKLVYRGTGLIGLTLIAIGAWGFPQLYTGITFTAAGLYLYWLGRIRKPSYLGKMWNAYLVAFIPFILVNGVLTGSGIENQVVWYNSDHIFNIRLGTIPIEDTVYNLLMLFMTMDAYEGIMQRRYPSSGSQSQRSPDNQ